MFRKRSTISIRDPLHGAIEFERDELSLLQHRALRRLTRIKQLGFAHHSYPGATHTRFIHSIGAMWVATRIWESIESYLRLSRKEFNYLLRLLRAAVLLHDIGHPPFSHSSEPIMPPLEKLGLEGWTEGRRGTAHHEDYTLKVILHSSLNQTLRELGLEPELLAHLLSGKYPKDPAPFEIKGYNFFPLLRQIIASELDADRMDYLRRDALYTGVEYGYFDLDWIIRNVRPVEREGAIYLGLDNKAIYTFEDFLLSRYQMFNSVYFHAASICYREMLRRYYIETPGEYTLPLDAEEYLETDDIQLMSVLRRSKNHWARRIVEQKPYQKVLEFVSRDNGGNLNQSLVQQIEEELKRAKIPFFSTSAIWKLSPYSDENSGEPTIFVFDSTFEKAYPLSHYSSLYRRYPETNRIFRLFVEPESFERAEKIVKKISTDKSAFFEVK